MTYITTGLLGWGFVMLLAWKTILHRKAPPVQVGAFLCLLGFSLSSTFAAHPLATQMDASLPYLSMYLAGLSLITAISSILFVILRRRMPDRQAGWMTVGIATGVGLMATWLFLTELIWLAPYKWAAVGATAQSEAQYAFGFLIIGYSALVGVLSCWVHFRLYRREAALAVRVRLLLTFISSLGLSLVFAILLFQYGLDYLGYPIDRTLFSRPKLASSLIAMIACLGTLLPHQQMETLLLHPFRVITAIELGFLQRQIARYRPPLYVALPSWYQKLRRPQECGPLAVTHILDAYHLLQHRSEPDIQYLCRLIKAADLPTKSYDEIVQSCRRIARHLWMRSLLASLPRFIQPSR